MMPFLSLVALLFASCGTTAKYPLKVELLSEPVVIRTEFSYPYVDDTGAVASQTVSPDWFQAAFNITNTGTETITVVSLRLVVDVPADMSASSGATGTSSSSSTTQATCDFSPSTSINTQSDYVLFELVPNESTSSKTVFNSGTFKGVGGYCSSLGFPENSVTFKTNVEVKVNGWIGPSTAATARLEIDTQNFDTQ